MAHAGKARRKCCSENSEARFVGCERLPVVWTSAGLMNSDLSNESRDAGGELRLLPEQALLTTGAVDHASWNYRPILGRIQRLRFDLVRLMLRGSRARRLLEIGYGSGVFLPELAQHGVQAKFVCGTATQMPYESGFFQTVVAVSALEFIDDLAQACREIKRVLAPGGIFALVTPGHSPLLDLGLRIVTGASPRDDFQARRPQILPGLYREFVVDRRADYPRSHTVFDFTQP
jgi:SAM-dependent methyltransferase